MNNIIYYQAYRDRTVQMARFGENETKQTVEQDLVLEKKREREQHNRMIRALQVASDFCIDENHVFVEAYDDTLATDGPFMQLLRSNQPTVVVMDSLSMFLQQFGLTYWITLLRTALQNGILPITIEEFKLGVHRDFDFALQARRTTIEALTEHIRPEPKRERGRRKLGPIADLVEIILLHTASPTSGNFPEFRSSHDVLEFISQWYEGKTHSGSTELQYDRVFAPDRWNTYKYKVRTMAKDALLDVLVEDFPEIAIPKDIWQPSELVDGRVVSIASLAAVKVLPDFGYQRIGYQWIKVLRSRDIVGDQTHRNHPTPQLDLEIS
jgi:hypothetical protein